MSSKSLSDLLIHLKLYGFKEALDIQLSNPEFMELDFCEQLSLLLEHEKSYKQNKKLARMISASNVKYRSACMENIDYQVKRGLNKKQLLSLAQFGWVQKFQNVLVTGPTGVGKTEIGCALAMNAVRQDYSALFFRMSRLLEMLEICRADGSLPRFRMKLAKADILVLDDLGITPLNDMNRRDLLDIIEDRVGSGSVVVTSQLPVNKWHEYIGENTLADAILDRLVHRSHKIQMRGESMRKLKESVGEDYV